MGYFKEKSRLIDSYVGEVEVHHLGRMLMNRSEKTIFTSNRSSNMNPKKGFTLVELIVVLVILAIMAAAIIPALLGYTDYAKNKKYIETANECLKASQSVLSNAYTDSSNYVNKNQRYSAADMAKVKVLSKNDETGETAGTTFCVWTAKKMIPGDANDSTKATKDNIGAYTIVYALYGTGPNDDDKHLFYDGKEWTVYDTKEEAWDAAGDKGLVASTEGDSKYMAMWPYEDVEVAHVDRDEDWLDDGQDTTTVTVTFKLAYNDQIGTREARPHGVLLKDGDVELTDDKDKEFTLDFTINANREVTCDLCPTGLQANSIINFDSGARSIFVEDGFDDLSWQTEKAEETGLTWDGSSDSDLLGEIASGKTVFYAYTEKVILEKDVYFKLYNQTTARFLSPVIDGGLVDNTVKTKFRCYKNKYDKEAGIYPDNFGSVPIVSPVGDEYRFDSWAYVIGDGYERQLPGGALTPYKDAKKICEKVFSIDNSTPTFIASMKSGHKVTLIADKNSYFENDGSNDLKEYVLESTVTELTNESMDNFDTYEDHRIAVEAGFRFRGWSLTEDSDVLQFYNDNLIAIRDYTLSSSKDVTLYAVTKPVSLAKIPGGTAVDKTGSVQKAITDLTGNSMGKMLVFAKAKYEDAVGELGDIYNSHVTNNDGDYTVNANSGVSFNGSGDIYKFAVIYNGKDPGYPVPVFAYSKKSGDNYNVYWFTEADNPLVDGSLMTLFSDASNCDFSNSGLEEWDYTGCSSTNQMFKNCRALKSGDISFNSWNLSGVKTIANMFEGCNNTNFKTVDFSNVDLAQITAMNNWVKSCTNLDTIIFNNVNSPLLTDITNYTDNKATLKYFYGRNWQAQSLTNLQTMFQNCTVLEEVDFSGANFESVTTMENAFNGAFKNGLDGKNRVDFSNANLSSLTNAYQMFQGSRVTDDLYCIKEISFAGADLSSLTNCRRMFQHQGFLTKLSFKDCINFHPVNCSEMFDYCISLEDIEGISDIHTDKTENMMNMFYRCKEMKDGSFLRNFDFSNVEITYRMFMGAGFEEIDLHEKDFTNLEYMSCMFGGKDHDGTFVYAEAKKINLSGCNIPNVTNLWAIVPGERNVSQLFEGNPFIEEVDMSGCSMPAVQSFEKMFQNSSIETVNFKNAVMAEGDEGVKSLNRMFYNCKSLDTVNCENWNISNVESLKEMFRESSIENFTLKDTAINKCTDLSYIFYSCPNLNSVDMSNLEAKNAIWINNMFQYSSVQKVNFSGSDMSGVSSVINNNASPFNSCSSFNEFNGEGWILSSATDIHGLFKGLPIEKVNLKNCNMENIQYVNQLFMDCKSLDIANVNLSGWNISGVKSMKEMFRNSSITSFDITNAFVHDENDMVNFEELTDLSYMFYDCKSMTGSVNLSNLNAKNASSINNMFNNSTVQIINFTNCDMSSVTNLSNLLKDCKSLTQFNAKGWKLSSATSISGMFSGCSSINTIIFDDCDMSSLTSLSQMFRNGYDSLVYFYARGWDIKNVTTMSEFMNRDSHSDGSGNPLSQLKVVDFAGANLSSVTNMYRFVRGRAAVETINFAAEEVNGKSYPDAVFGTEKLTSINDMFADTHRLVSLNMGNNFDTSKVTAMKATFWGCGMKSSVSIDLSGWDLSSVKDMENCFINAKINELKLPKNMQSLTKINTAFKDTEITTLDLRGWTIGKASYYSVLSGAHITNLYMKGATRNGQPFPADFTSGATIDNKDF